MRVVNLSSRPFLNRRPAVRLSIFLWSLGVLLLLTNAWLYADHFSDSAKTQSELAAFDRQLQEERNLLDTHIDDMRALRLPARNARAEYLNTLIRQRTFPWSALFDDLERILPIDVYLESVKPVRTVEDSSASARTTRAASTTQRLTPAERRARARAQRAAGGDRATATTASTRNQPSTRVQELAEDEQLYKVSLSVKGIARNDDAMIELLDRLYSDESFEQPNLVNEARNRSGLLRFNLKVHYLPPRPEPPEPELPEEGAPPGEEAALVEQGSPEEGEGSEAEGGERAANDPVPADPAASRQRLLDQEETTLSEGEAPVIRADSARRPSMRERLESNERRQRARSTESRSPSGGGGGGGGGGGTGEMKEEPASRVSVRPTRTPPPRRTEPQRTETPQGSTGTRIVPRRPLQATPPPPPPPPPSSPRGETVQPDPRQPTEPPRIQPPEPIRTPASGSAGLRLGSLVERLFPEVLLDFLAPVPGNLDDPALIDPALIDIEGGVG